MATTRLSVVLINKLTHCFRLGQSFQVFSFLSLFPFFSIIFLFNFLFLGNIQAQTIPSASAEVSNVTTSSATYANVTGTGVTLDVTNVDKVMIIATFTLNLTTSTTQDASFRIADDADNTINSGDIVRAANQLKGSGTQVYIFDVSAYSGNRTYYLQHKVAGGVTLNTSASIAAIALYDGATNFQADVKSIPSAVATSSTTWTEVTGSTTTAITTTDAGGFVVMSTMQVAKTAGSSAVGEWKLQYKVGSNEWTDLGYSVERYMTGANTKGIVKCLGSLPTNTLPDTYSFRIMHRLKSGVSSPAFATQAANIITASFANPNYVYQVLQGVKTSVSTSNNTYSDAISMPVTTNVGITPKLLMLGQFNMEANNASNAPKFDFAINSGAFYDGLDYLRSISSSVDIGSAAIVSISPSMAASTEYILSMRHASNPTVPVRHLTTYNILCVGVALNDNAFVVYPVSVNSTLGVNYANYNTLKEAFDKINDGTHKGVIQITINGNTTETASAVLNESGSGSANYTSINILPSGPNLQVSGNLSAPIIDLNGADNVTIDGRILASGSSPSLTIQNTSTNAAASAIRFINSAQNNTLQYCTLKAAPNVANCGVVHVSTSSSSSGSGNDYITINNNNITNNGSTSTIYNAVYIAGSNPKQSNYITVSDNNIYDFINTTVGSAGVHVASYADNITISGNSFYQTSAVSVSGVDQYYAPVHTENTAITSLTVTNNYIGGSEPLCAGSAFTMSGSDDYQLETIDLHLSGTSSVLVDGNIIKNIAITSEHTQPFLGIDIVQGSATITNNTIGATTGNGSITITNTTNNSSSNGIWLEDITDITVDNNTIGAITTVGSASYSCGFIGINNEIDASAGTVVITNNLIGSLTTASSIQASAASTSTTGQQIIGIKSAAIGTTTINNNTVQNISNAYAGISNTARTAGIYTYNGSNTIRYNTVKNISSASAQVGVVDSASVCGIGQMSETASSTQDVSFNTVSDIANTTATAQVNVVGICFSAPTTGTQKVNSNFVYDLSIASSNTASMIGGIAMKSGIGECSNNIVSLGTTVTSGVGIVGINDHAESGFNHQLYFNTVHIGGTVSSGATANTQALRRVYNVASSNYRGNIFSNQRSGGTGGTHYAAYLSGITAITIDYNDYYAPSGVLAYIGGDLVTLANIQTATSQDANSVNTDPSFDTAGGDLPTDYYINAALWITNPTTITVDYGQILRGSPTLMGALERHDYYWQGDGSTDFATAANWDVNAVPLPGANIIFIDNPYNSCYLDADRVVGDIDINQNDDILVLNGHKLTIVGDIIESTINQIDADGATDVVEFAGRTAQTFPVDVFVNDAMGGLELDNSYGFSLPQSIATGDLLLTDGQFTIGSNTLTINDAITTTSGTIVGGSTSSIVIGDAGSVPSTTLPAIELYDLTVNRANGISLGGNVTVANSLTLTNGAIAVGANTLTMSGSTLARTSGSINASNASANLEFLNTTSITLPAGTFSAAITNLRINGGGLVASEDITVSGVLNLESENPLADVGLLDMGIDTLHVGSTSTSLGLGDVEGVVKRTGFSYNTVFSFGNPYNTMFFATQAYTLPTVIYAKVVLESPSWDSDAILRTMDLVKTGGDDNLTFRGSVHYTDGELNANLETRLSIWMYDNSISLEFELGKTEVNVSENWVGIGTATLSLLSTDFGVGEFTLDETGALIYTWDGSESTNWLDPSNWSTGLVPADSCDVRIPDAVTTLNDPTLPSDTTIHSLVLEIGAILNGGTATSLTIAGGAGAFINEGGQINPETNTLIFTNANATWSGELDVYNLTIETGASIVPVTGGYMTIYGTVTNNGTWKSALTANTVEYAGAAQTVLNTNGLQTGYYNLMLSGSGTKTMPATALSVSNDFTMKGTASAALLNNLEVDGNVSLEDTATCSVGTHTVIFSGDVHIHNSASLSSEASGSITMNGSAKELLIDPLARFDNVGTFVSAADGYITFVSNNTSTGQLLNTGTVTNASAIVRLQKQMLSATGWYFMSMPFDVPNSSITDAGTGTPVTWTGLTGVADIYVQAYDGFNRDDEGLPNVSGSGVYWIDVPSKQMDQYKGYIVATDYDKTLNFSSAAGESDLFTTTTVSVPVSKYTTNTYSQHHSWNLLGNPFSSGFDLYDATQAHAPFYYYNGSNYVTVMAGDHYTPYPFMAFFLQAFGASNTLDFAAAGLEFRSATASLNFEEIDLSILQNDTLNDRLRIRLHTDATVNFDPSIDAFKFRSLNLTYPQLYARSNNYNYSVHALAPVATEQTISLTYIAGVADTFSIVLNTKNLITKYDKVSLRDATLSKEQDLLADSIYTFTSAKGTFSSRFSILLGAPLSTATAVAVNKSITALSTAGKVSFDGLQGKATVAVYDIAGKLIVHYADVQNKQYLPISLYGVYIFKVATDSQRDEFKLLLTK